MQTYFLFTIRFLKESSHEEVSIAWVSDSLLSFLFYDFLGFFDIVDFSEFFHEIAEVDGQVEHGYICFFSWITSII